MNSIADLLASWLDLKGHDVPDDASWLAAREAALRSIANAIEDDESVESLDDEIDRTLLLDAVRTEALLIGGLIARHGTTSEVIGELAVNRLVPMMVPEPMGLRPALRLLELRRMGIEQALASGAERLGLGSDWQEAWRVLSAEGEADDGRDHLAAAFDLLRSAGIDVPPGIGETLPADGLDISRMIRLIVAAMQVAARSRDDRAVRGGIWNHGAAEGWQRTVAALVHRETAAVAPEDGFRIARAAMLDGVAAEVDLRFHGGSEDWPSLARWAVTVGGLADAEVVALQERVIAAPLAAAASALAHEGWQGWYAEEGVGAGEFVALTLPVSWLPVPLARWAMQVK